MNVKEAVMIFTNESQSDELLENAIKNKVRFINVQIGNSYIKTMFLEKRSS